MVILITTDDTVVPRESQDKIIASITSAQERLTYEIKDVAHNLTGSTVDRKDVLSRLISFCTKQKKIELWYLYLYRIDYI